jgi:hypothetical protein
MFGHRQQLHRKQLQASYLRDTPDDEALHRACQMYEPPALRAAREQRELQEAMQVRTTVLYCATLYCNAALRHPATPVLMLLGKDAC